jgi:hypothetical protein
MKTTATNRKIHQLLTAIREEKLIPRPDFQRRLVWTDKDKRAFLQTVLESYPFPEIYIAAGTVDPDTGDATELLVDGQQRVTTLYQYFTDTLGFSLNKIPPYSQLEKQQKMDFLDYDVVVRDLGNKTIIQIKEIFERINSTKYSLNAMEINNARYNGAFKIFADELSLHEFFERHKFFTPAEIRRMLDVQFCAMLTITLLTTYVARNDDMEKFLNRYNDEFGEGPRLLEQINKVFQIIDACEFEEKSRVWHKSDLFTLIVEFHKAVCKKKKLLDTKQTAKHLKDFYERVDQGDKNEVIFQYATLSRKAINDRSNRIQRGQIISDVLDGILP